MKASIIASTIALFASSALAAPAPVAQSGTPAPTEFFTFSLINDITGASAARFIQINAPQPFVLGNLFAGSNLVKNGKVVATSAQNIRPDVKNVFCVFKGNGQVIKINDRATFAQLDGDANKAVETDVSQFTIECQK